MLARKCTRMRTYAHVHKHVRARTHACAYTQTSKLTCKRAHNAEGHANPETDTHACAHLFECRPSVLSAANSAQPSPAPAASISLPADCLQDIKFFSERTVLYRGSISTVELALHVPTGKHVVLKCYFKAKMQVRRAGQALFRVPSLSNECRKQNALQ